MGNYFSPALAAHFFCISAVLTYLSMGSLCTCVHIRISASDVKQPISQQLPYSSNVIKSFLVYLYTNAPPVSSAGQKSKYSPLLSDDELVQLSQLANQSGLTQLAQYCSPPQPQGTPSTTNQPSSVSEMLEKFGLGHCMFLSLA